jgi:hypothetical protein
MLGVRRFGGRQCLTTRRFTVKRVVFSALLTSTIGIAPCFSAGDKGPPKPILPKGTPAEQVKDLIARHEEATAAFRNLFKAAKTEEEQEKLESLFPDPRPYAELLVQIAEKNPKDPAAVDALVWAYRNDRSAKAKAILLRDHLLHPKIGPLCLALRYDSDAGTLSALRKVLAENPSKEAQTHAAVGLGIRLKSNAELAREMQKADAKTLAVWEKNFGKEVVAALRTADPAALKKEAEQLMERVIKDAAYAKITIPFGEQSITLGKLAGRELFEMRSLQPGKIAPDIVGEDIDGKPMKLSDFRGKVVLLDFWGFW